MIAKATKPTGTKPEPPARPTVEARWFNLQLAGDHEPMTATTPDPLESARFV